MLDQWKKQHQASLYEILTPNLILFGEWCYSKHSIHYTRLPGYFLAFDIFDKSVGKFVSIDKRNELLEGSGIPTVPLVARGVFTDAHLKNVLANTPSTLYAGPMEGLYFRIEKDGYLVERGKIVREDFLADAVGDEGDVVHWSKREVIKNIVLFE